MQKKDWYIKLLIGITSLLITFTTLTYPISKVLTDPNQVNNIFDSINVEKYFTELYISWVTTEVNKITELDNYVKEDLIKKVNNNIVDQKSLRKQRILAIETLYKKIEQNEVPYFTFNLSNPLYTVYQKVNDTGKNFLDQLLNQSFCTEMKLPSFLDKFVKEEDNLKCISLKQVVSDKNNTFLYNPTYEISTSFGVTTDNIEKVHKIFIITKYLPPNLLIFSAILYGIILIPILRNREKDEWYKSPLKILVQNIIINLFAWILFPTLIRILEPLNPKSIQNINILNISTQTAPILSIISELINKFIYETFLQMRVYALITSIIFIAIFLIHWIIWFAMKKIQKMDRDDKEKYL